MGSPFSKRRPEHSNVYIPYLVSPLVAAVRQAPGADPVVADRLISSQDEVKPLAREYVERLHLHLLKRISVGCDHDHGVIVNGNL